MDSLPEFKLYSPVKIDAFYIGNFKAFGELQRIPIKPITLLFGPNSSGKSSIIHSIAMVHESQLGGLKRFSSPLDVYRTEIGGESIDLGGFNQYVYGGEKSNCISWGVETSLINNLSIVNNKKVKKFLIDVGFDNISMIISIGHKLDKNSKPLDNSQPEVVCIEIKTDDDTIIKICKKDDSDDDCLFVSYLAKDHLIFRNIFKNFSTNTQNADYEIIEKFVEDLLPFILIDIDRLLPSDVYLDESEDEDILSISVGNDKNDLDAIVKKYLPQILKAIVKGCSDWLESALKEFQYLGPLRTILSRHFAFSDYRGDAPDAGGTYAWNEIGHHPELRDKINLWLGSEKLKTRYQITTRTYTNNLNSINETVLVDMLSNTTVTHRDVGVGISQVLPVLVTAYGSFGKLIAIEQPEIHLHPALQAELGDVFIESALENENTFILETHSEHLILRLLRRIRETTNGELSEGMKPVRPKDICVLYIQPDTDGAKVIEIPITPEGDFAKPWPEGFFAERAEELFG